MQGLQTDTIGTILSGTGLGVGSQQKPIPAKDGAGQTG
jgi:hypothetical protein